MKKRLLTSFGLFLLMFSFLLALFCLAVTKARAASPDETTRTLEVRPAKSSNGTNAFAVYDKTGTNYFRVGPTNAAISYRTGGVLYTGVTVTVTVLNTNATTNAVLIFKNGLLVNGP